MLNKKIEEALNAQINAELWSAYLYLSMAAYAHANGNPGMAIGLRYSFRRSRIMPRSCSITSYSVADVLN